MVCWTSSVTFVPFLSYTSLSFSIYIRCPPLLKQNTELTTGTRQVSPLSTPESQLANQWPRPRLRQSSRPHPSSTSLRYQRKAACPYSSVGNSFPVSPPRRSRAPLVRVACNLVPSPMRATQSFLPGSMLASIMRQPTSTFRPVLQGLPLTDTHNNNKTQMGHLSERSCTHHTRQLD